MRPAGPRPPPARAAARGRPGAPGPPQHIQLTTRVCGAYHVPSSPVRPLSRPLRAPCTMPPQTCASLPELGTVRDRPLRSTPPAPNLTRALRTLLLSRGLDGTRYHIRRCRSLVDANLFLASVCSLSAQTARPHTLAGRLASSTTLGATRERTISTACAARLSHAKAAIVPTKTMFATSPRSTTGRKSSPRATAHPAVSDRYGPTRRKKDT